MENLISKIQKLNKSLSKRMENIKKLGFEELVYDSKDGKYAYQQYEDLVESMGVLDVYNFSKQELRTLSKKQLTTLYRDLKYIDELKTSTVKGMQKALDRWESIKQKLSWMSEKDRKLVWDAFSTYLDRNPTADRFKYEVLETIADYSLWGGIESSGELGMRIRELLEESKYESGKDIEALKLSFSKKLQDLL